MAGKERGTNFTVKVRDSASVPTYHSIAGQKTGALKINGNQIDASDKDSGDWGASEAGLKSLGLTISGNAVWPDTNGLDIVRAAATTPGGSVFVEVVMASNGAKYAAEMVVPDYTIDGPDNGMTTYNISLTNKSTPVYTAGS